MRGLALRASMIAARARYWAPLAWMARRPDRAQHRVLMRILARHRTTRFGERHRFPEIDTHEQFARRVPVHDYEMLRPYVEEQRRTGSPALTAEAPLFYAQTSGTTGQPKYLPITRTVLAMHRAEQALFSYLQFRACPEAFAGKGLGILGAAVEGTLDSGHAVGSVSGHLYASLPAVLRARWVVPPEVLGIADYTLKYLAVLHLALCEPRITYMGTPNPATFLRVRDLLNEQREPLLRGLETGTFQALDALEPHVRHVVAAGSRADGARAAALRRLPALGFAAVWPGIRLVTTWTGGSCGIALARLRQDLPAGARVMELGYQATEGRGTVALQPETAGGLPPLHHHFFEFVEHDRWDAGRPEFLTLDRLEAGRRYYVLFTTLGGLYRYFINDLVEVTGVFHRTPLLRFVQKGRGVTSLVGEKLYEAQAIEAVQGALAGAGVHPRFFLLVADVSAAAYRLYLETGEPMPPDTATIGHDVDRRLGALNIEYQGKRASGRLGPIEVRPLAPGTAERYLTDQAQVRTRDSQWKPPVLQSREDVAFPFDAHVLVRAPQEP